MDENQVNADEISVLGLQRIADNQPYRIAGQGGELRKIEVHSVRPVQRVSPDGNILSDLVVEITQTFRPNGGGRFRGGCTLVINMETAEVRYMIRKKVVSPDRFAQQVQFGVDSSEGLHGNYFDSEGATREPFALMHHVHG